MLILSQSPNTLLLLQDGNVTEIVSAILAATEPHHSP
jgi:hypothetical protein